MKHIALAATAALILGLPSIATADPFDNAHNACIEAGSQLCMAIGDEGITVARIAAALKSSPETIIMLNNWEGEVTPETVIPTMKRFQFAESA